ncbi:MAG TPA: 2-dehydropantoate 2-reductase [Kofleriaceae bacterium]|nr:2-dehydropantoate 2-reductase [Kofleriaceae bacterium]
MNEDGLRVLVMGTGAIGGTVAGHLSEVGADVTAVTTNQRIFDSVRAGGFRLVEDGETRRVRGRISLGVPGDSQYDVVLLATQPPQVEEAARSAMAALADGGVMVCFQNGLCEQRIAALVGSERVVGAIVAWGASMPEPGHYDRTAAGGFVIGRISGPPDGAAMAVGRLLEAVAPVTFTTNLAGARWSKLALNAAVSSIGTLGGDRLGALIRVRRYRRLALEIFTEAVAVAQSEGVILEKVAGTLDLGWVALTEAERRQKAGSPNLAAKHALLLAVGLRYRRLRSSMLAAIERGREPAVDFLNGEIASRGRERNIATPVNARIVDGIWALARKERSPSRQLLDELYKETRQLA